MVEMAEVLCGWPGSSLSGRHPAGPPLQQVSCLPRPPRGSWVPPPRDPACDAGEWLCSHFCVPAGPGHVPARVPWARAPGSLGQVAKCSSEKGPPG